MAIFTPTLQVRCDPNIHMTPFRLGVTPMMVSGLTLGMFWHLAIQKSFHFNSPYTAVNIKEYWPLIGQ